MDNNSQPIKISTLPAFFPWRPAAWLRVTGEDAATFLQGQFTNELRGLAAGGSVYGLWLTIKGKVLADSFVVKGAATPSEPEGFWLGSYASSAAVIRERLEAFVIADDVVIEDETDRWAGLTTWSAESTALVAARSGSVNFTARRGLAGATEWLLPRDAAEVARRALVAAGIREASELEMERTRIAAGIPLVPRDIGPTDLPNEAGLEAEAISYTKGCYLGQEVMARLKSMGQVRRRLVPVHGTAALPPEVSLPAPLFLDQRQVGELRSAVSAGEGSDAWLGLAMVSLIHVRAGAKLTLAAGGPVVVEVGEIPGTSPS